MQSVGLVSDSNGLGDRKVDLNNPLPITSTGTTGLNVNVTNSSIPITAASLPLPTGASTDTSVSAVTTAINSLSTSMDELYYLMRQLMACCAAPEWLSKASNALQVLVLTGSTTAVTGSLTSAGTVSTVTSLTQLGGVDAGQMVSNDSATMWATSIRSLLV